MKELDVYVNEWGYVEISKGGVSLFISLDNVDELHHTLESIIYERDAMSDSYQSLDALDPAWDDFDDNGVPF